MDHLREWIQTSTQIIAFLGAISIAIYQQRRIDIRTIEDRRRDLLAARAALPMSLAIIDTYIKDCKSFIDGIRTRDDHPVVFTGPLSLPPFPASVIPDLKSLVKLSDQSIGDEAATLMRFLQIHLSRIERMFAPGKIEFVVHKHDFDRMYLDTMYLSILNSRFYNYARFRSDRIDTYISSEDMKREDACHGSEIVDVSYLIDNSYPPPKPSVLATFFRRRSNS